MIVMSPSHRFKVDFIKRVNKLYEEGKVGVNIKRHQLDWLKKVGYVENKAQFLEKCSKLLEENPELKNHEIFKHGKLFKNMATWQLLVLFGDIILEEIVTKYEENKNKKED